MLWLFVVVIAIVAFVLAFAASQRKDAVSRISSPGDPAKTSIKVELIEKPHVQPRPYTTVDGEIERIAAKHKATFFHSRIAGVSYANDDGNSRQEPLARAKPLDMLHLVPDGSNAYSEYATKVLNVHGEQLGFLPSEVARQVQTDTDDVEWVAVLVSVARANGGALGATIALFRVPS